MTGEITLLGRVLAHWWPARQGAGGLSRGHPPHHLARREQKDIGEIPDRVRGQMEFIFVANMEEVEKAALRTERQGTGPAHRRFSA